MKLIECTSCKCTATIEDENTLPSGWCEVNIPNKTVASFTGVLCEECKMKLMTRIIEKGAYVSAINFGDNGRTEIKDPSKPIIIRYPQGDIF